MGFVVHAIGNTGTVLLASQAEGARSDWPDGLNVFTESVGMGGVNDVSILKTTDKNDIMQFSVKSKSKTPQFRSNVEIIRHNCLHAE